MNSRNFKLEGIVVKRIKYSEADRIITFFTKEKGKITLIAKGVRFLKSRKGASLEIFNHCFLEVSKTSNLGVITEVSILDSFAEIRKDLKRISVAFFLAESLEALVGEEQKHFELFFILLKYLNELKTSTKTKKLRENFIYEVLVNLGFWPKHKDLAYPDQVIENIIERKLSSTRVGKRILS